VNVPMPVHPGNPVALEIYTAAMCVITVGLLVWWAVSRPHRVRLVLWWPAVLHGAVLRRRSDPSSRLGRPGRGCSRRLRSDRRDDLGWGCRVLW
jgi:hypothetical protein